MEHHSRSNWPFALICTTSNPPLRQDLTSVLTIELTAPFPAVYVDFSVIVNCCHLCSWNIPGSKGKTEIHRCPAENCMLYNCSLLSPPMYYIYKHLDFYQPRRKVIPLKVSTSLEKYPFSVSAFNFCFAFCSMQRYIPFFFFFLVSQKKTNVSECIQCRKWSVILDFWLHRRTKMVENIEFQPLVLLVHSPQWMPTHRCCSW